MTARGRNKRGCFIHVFNKRSFCLPLLFQPTPFGRQSCFHCYLFANRFWCGSSAWFWKAASFVNVITTLLLVSRMSNGFSSTPPSAMLYIIMKYLGYIYIYIYIHSMSVQANLRPSHNEKTFAMKAERTVKRITFDRNEAKPGETLYIIVSKLN